MKSVLFVNATISFFENLFLVIVANATIEYLSRMSDSEQGRRVIL